MDLTPRSRRGAPRGGVVAGAIIIGIGTLLLLHEFGIMPDFDWSTYWPVILIVIGALNLSDRKPGGQTGGVILIGIGALFLLRELGIIHFLFRQIWPVFVIALGAGLLLQALRRPQFERGFTRFGNALNEWTVFGGGKRVITATNFQGGEVFAVFGGHEIDLRDADIEGDSAGIHVTVVFGGAEFKVPGHWEVVSKVMPVFGGFEDKTAHPRPDSGKPVKRLFISGAVVFGGFEVKN